MVLPLLWEFSRLLTTIYLSRLDIGARGRLVFTGITRAINEHDTGPNINGVLDETHR